MERWIKDFNHWTLAEDVEDALKYHGIPKDKRYVEDFK